MPHVCHAVFIIFFRIISDKQFNIGSVQELGLLVTATVLAVAVPFSLFADKEQQVAVQQQQYSNSQTLDLLSAGMFTTDLGYGAGSIEVIDNAIVADVDDFTISQTGHGDNASIDTATVIRDYIVQSGDSISTIAARFGVTQATVISANKLKNNTIGIGQELQILPVSGVLHTIVSGDTVSKIAKKYKADEDELMAFNGFGDNDILAKGETIIVPGGKIQVIKKPVVKKAVARTVSTPKTKTYQASTGGYFIRPIVGYRLSRGIHGHNAVDIAAPRGTPILASASGVVQTADAAGWNYGYGQYVAITHPNGTRTIYAHMSAINVYQGQSVVQGQVIGYVGTTGNSTGNHLHFEVRNARNPVTR